MLFSTALFAYSFNVISNLLEDTKKTQKLFKKEMFKINRFLDTKKIGADVKIQVRKFLEFSFINKTDLSPQEEENVLSKLSSNLRNKIKLQANLGIINQCSQIFNNFSK